MYGTLVQVHSETITNLSSRFELPSGDVYTALCFAFDGTNQSGQTLTSDNLGTLRVLKNGTEIHNINVEDLVDIHNLEYGILEEASVAAGAFRHFVRLPFALPTDFDVAFLARPSDKIEIIHNFPDATATVVASGVVTYYAEVGSGVELAPYELQWRNHNITVGAAGTITQRLKLDNVSALYVENDATVLTSLGLRVDGRLVQSDVPRDDMYAHAQGLRHIETFSATTPIMKIDLNAAEVREAAINTDMEITIVAAAAGTLDIVALSVFPALNKFNQSLEFRNNTIIAKRNMKANQGIEPAVAVLDGEIIR